jgi:hypothetical protein
VNRFLVTWRDRSVPRTYPVGVLLADEAGYGFTYLPAAESTPGFRPFVNFPDLGRRYRSSTLFPFFAQRVMDQRRPDHPAYLQALGLAPDAIETDVLGRANGQRKGDTVQVILEPHVDPNGDVDHVFLVSGVRHAPGNPESKAEHLGVGDGLTLRAEPNNPSNPSALLVCTPPGDPIGWSPDALLHLAHQVIKNSYRLNVVRVNGADWPSHLRVIVRLTGSVSPGFEPFPSLVTLTAV